MTSSKQGYIRCATLRKFVYNQSGQNGFTKEITMFMYYGIDLQINKAPNFSPS